MQCQFCKGTKVERLAADDVVACVWCDSTGVDGGLSKGNTDPVGDCDKFESGVNVGPWMQRVVVYGDTAAQAESLRDKILALMVAAQPPALGGEPEPICEVVDEKYNRVQFYRQTGDTTKKYHPPGTKLITLDTCRAHLAPLQAEIERLNSVERSYQLREELLDQVKDERDRMIERACELSPEVDRLTARTAELERLLREVVALDPRGEFMGWHLDGRIDAALSKPAGTGPRTYPISEAGMKLIDEAIGKDGMPS